MNVDGNLTAKVTLDCEYCGTASARCIDESGVLCCALCPLKKGLDAIRLSDVPQLLAWSRSVLAGAIVGDSIFEKLRAIVGRHPKESM